MRCPTQLQLHAKNNVFTKQIFCDRHGMTISSTERIIKLGKS